MRASRVGLSRLRTESSLRRAVRRAFAAAALTTACTAPPAVTRLERRALARAMSRHGNAQVATVGRFAPDPTVFVLIDAAGEPVLFRFAWYPALPAG